MEIGISIEYITILPQDNKRLYCYLQGNLMWDFD